MATRRAAARTTQPTAPSVGHFVTEGSPATGSVAQVRLDTGEEAVLIKLKRPPAPLPGAGRRANVERLATVVAHATEILSGQENALTWLRTPNPALAGRSPLELLESGRLAQVDQVDELLFRIEHGIFS